MKVVPRASSVEERFRSLKQLRPRFRLPEKISAIWWPKSIASLVERGVWDAIVQRIGGGGFAETARSCDVVLEELRALEQREIVNAISGEGYQVLWEK